MRRLTELAKRVTEQLIPELEAEGARFAAEELQPLDDPRLAVAILTRAESLRRWKKIYWDEFIPFAHGARQLGRYYNDAVRPDDPYEFVGLLKSEDMLASRRNRAMAGLATKLRANPQLRDALTDLLRGNVSVDATACSETLASVRDLTNGSEFVEELTAVTAEFMDVTYGAQRLLDRPGLLLHTLLELANVGVDGAASGHSPPGSSRSDLEQRLFDAVGPARREEATEVLRVGRVSWRLRDDDNLLLSRVESQLFRAVDLAQERLRAAGRLRGSRDDVPKRYRRLSLRREIRLTLRSNCPRHPRKQKEHRSRRRRRLGSSSVNLPRRAWPADWSAASVRPTTSRGFERARCSSATPSSR